MKLRLLQTEESASRLCWEWTESGKEFFFLFLTFTSEIKIIEMERVAGKRKSSFCYPFFFFVAL